MAVVVNIVSAYNGKGVRQAITSLEDLQRAAKIAGGGISGGLIATGAFVQGVSKQVSAAGSSLTRNVTVPVGLLGAAVVHAAVEWESAFAGVRKTVDGTEADFAMLDDGIREMSSRLPQSAADIAGVAEAAGQLGIQTDAILGFTEVMVNLGDTTNLSSDEAATALARLANITQMPQTEFDRLGATIVDLGNNLATTEAEIVQMGLRIAGAGETIGLTEAETLGFAAALSSVGIEAQAGGSAISRVMVDMAVAVSSGSGAMEDLARSAGIASGDFSTLIVEMNSSSDRLSELATNAGMSNDKFKELVGNLSDGRDRLDTIAATAGMTSEAFVKAFQDDPASAIEAFITGLGGVEDKFGVIASLKWDDIRIRDALLRSANAGDLLTNSLDIASTAWQENTALTDEAAKRYETFESQTAMLKNQLTDTGITLGQAIIPALRDALTAAQPFFDAIKRGAEWFSNLDESQQKTILKLVGFAVALGPVLSIVGKVGSLVGGVSKGIGYLGMAFGENADKAPMLARAIATVSRSLWALATNPVVLTVVAIGAAIALVAYLIYKNWDTIKAFLMRTWETIKSVATTVWNGIVGVFRTAFDFIMGIINAALEPIKAAFNVYMTVIKAAWWVIQAIVATAVWAIRKVIEVVFGWIQEYIFPIFEGIKNVIASAWEWISSRTTERVENIRATVERVLNRVKEIFKNIWEGVKAVVAPVLLWLSEKIGGALDSIQQKWETVWGAVSSFFSDIWDGLKGIVKNALNGIIDIVNSGIRALNSLSVTMPDIPGFPNRGETFSLNLSEIPRLAEGGIVPAVGTGTLALIGEGARDEAVIPLPLDWRRNGFGSGVTVQSGAVQVTVNVTGGDPVEVQRAVEDSIDVAFRRLVRELAVA